MRSQDNGETWEPVNPSLHRDVHEVAISQTDPNKVYANTYLSVYVTNDRGENWSHRSDSLNKRYGRGFAVHPEDTNILLCGLSDGPSGSNVHGQLYRTENAGETWSNIETGFPKYTRKNIDTFHIAFGSQAAWVTDEETLYRSMDDGKTWETFWKATEEITMISLNQRNEVR